MFNRSLIKAFFLFLVFFISICFSKAHMKSVMKKPFLSNFQSSVAFETALELNEKRSLSNVLYNTLNYAGNNWKITSGFNIQKIYKADHKGRGSFKIITPPYLIYTRTLFLRYKNISLDSVFIGTGFPSETAREKYSQVSFLNSGAKSSILISSRLNFDYSLKIIKSLNNYQNGPHGSNTSYSIINSASLNYKIIKNLSLSSNIQFINNLSYSNTLKGSHNLSYTLTFIKNNYLLQLALFSGSNNLKYNRNNFALYHRNSSTVSFVVGGNF